MFGRRVDCLVEESCFSVLGKKGRTLVFIGTEEAAWYSGKNGFDK